MPNLAIPHRTVPYGTLRYLTRSATCRRYPITYSTVHYPTIPYNILTILHNTFQCLAILYSTRACRTSQLNPHLTHLTRPHRTLPCLFFCGPTRQSACTPKVPQKFVQHQSQHNSSRTLSRNPFGTLRDPRNPQNSKHVLIFLG